MNSASRRVYPAVWRRHGGETPPRANRAMNLRKGFEHMLKKILAWGAHAYTALGLVAAGGVAVAIVDESFRIAFLLMLVATLIDATDGTLARAVKVKEVLPHFDGGRLDDLIDFQTYTSLPLLLIWRAKLVPPEWQPVLIAPLLASAYGFCQTTAKTDDGYFLGFPSYWNIIAFYLYVLRPSTWFTVAILCFFALMTFVPARYLYPTHRGRLNRWTNQLGAIWAILLIWIVWYLPEAGTEDGEQARQLTLVSLFFPIYYLGLSWYVSCCIWRRAYLQIRLASRTP
jgi:phosphatidylcholine synthase